MKYCLFDGGDVVGPFSAKELLLRPGFDSHSLVCPEEHSDEETYWKEAHFYEEFGFDPMQAPQPGAKAEAASAAQSEQFLKEMDTVMTELSSLNVGGKEPAPSGLAEASGRKTHEAAPAADKTSGPPAQAKPAQPDLFAAPDGAPSQTAEPDASERKISSILMQASKEMRRQQNTSAQAASAEEKTETLPPLQPAAPQDGPGANPALQPDPETEVVARTISKVSPIEEYFNTIKSGDLGNILGIPDPKENSDMSLARALESQFEKTEPGGPGTRPIEEDPFDEFTVKEKPEEVDESLFAPTPDDADEKTREKLKKDLPDLKSAAPLALAGQTLPQAETETQQTEPPALQEMIVPEQEDDPNDRTVKTILEGKLKVDTLRREIPEPIKEVPADDAKPAPAPQEGRPPEEDAQDDFLKERVVKRRPAGMMKFIFLGMGVLLLLAGAFLNWTLQEDPVPAARPEAAQTAAPAPDAKAAPSAREVIHALNAEEPKDPLELAKQIVQDHPLGKGRGTVEQYLAQRYAKELSSGYAAMWSAEPLHRDVYVVKYRLAKTRKEPIVYIFQADTAKKKLTGALNNITLDLVGKIR